MEKVLTISVVLLSVVFLAGCGQQPASQTQSLVPTAMTQQPPQSPSKQQVATQANDETTSWQTYKNDKYGIEFKYPKDIIFNSGSEGSNGWYTVSANYDHSGDNFFDFTVLDKTEGMQNINLLKYREKNLFASSAPIFQNGKFIQVDGYGTANYYFVDAYYEGKDYVYHFMMSRPDHSKDLLELFEKILSTAKLVK